MCPETSLPSSTANAALPLVGAKKLISIVIPAYNESGVIHELASRLIALMNNQQNYEFEVIIVENGSADDSWGMLKSLNLRDRRFKIIQLSRNFLFDGAILAALRMAAGHAAIIMNADLQDPPELIARFLDAWENGNEIVYGVIEGREGEPRWKSFLSDVYYGLLNRMTMGLIPKQVTDFRLLDRKVYATMCRMIEANRFTRGLSIWSGWRQTGIPFVRPPRFAGESKVSVGELFREACDGIFSFSYIPIRISTYIGVFLIVFAIMLLGYQIVTTYMFGGNLPGYLTIVFLNLVMFGALFLVLSIHGEYISRIFDEVRRRPPYVIRHTIGWDELLDDDARTGLTMPGSSRRAMTNSNPKLK